MLETFRESYELDGRIVGLPDGPVHLEIVRLQDARHPAQGLLSSSAAVIPGR